MFSFHKKRKNSAPPLPIQEVFQPQSSGTVNALVGSPRKHPDEKTKKRFSLVFTRKHEEGNKLEKNNSENILINAITTSASVIREENSSTDLTKTNISTTTLTVPTIVTVVESTTNKNQDDKKYDKKEEKKKERRRGKT